MQPTADQLQQRLPDVDATMIERHLSRMEAAYFERFDLERLQAGVFETNPASARVLEKAGYVREGRLRRAVVKDGRVLDLLMYARIRGED